MLLSLLKLTFVSQTVRFFLRAMVLFLHYLWSATGADAAANSPREVAGECKENQTRVQVC